MSEKPFSLVRGDSYQDLTKTGGGQTQRHDEEDKHKGGAECFFQFQSLGVVFNRPLEFFWHPPWWARRILTIQFNPDKVVASECSDFLRDLCNLKKLSMQQTDLNLRHLNFKLFTGTKIMDFQGKQFIHSCVFIFIFPFWRILQRALWI